MDLETDRKALGAQCPSCKNGIICLPSTDNCDNCKMVVDDKFVKEFDDVMELTKFHLKNDRNIARKSLFFAVKNVQNLNFSYRFRCVQIMSQKAQKYLT